MTLSRRLILVFFCIVLGLSARAQTATTDTTVEATDTESTGTRINVDTTTTEKEGSQKVPDSLRRLPDSTVRSWKKDPDLAYANDPSYWKKEPLQEPSDNWFFRLMRSKGTKYFIYLLLGSILLFAIVRILTDNNLLFYRRGRRGKVESESAPDMMLENPDEGLQQAILAKDHRLAVRYLYIKTLHQLGDRGLVRYHLKTTNQEYIQQLNGSPLERPFRYLTGIYDRVWYGEFALKGDQFERIHTYFKDFYKSIGA